MTERIRTIAAAGNQISIRFEGRKICFDESRGYLAQVRESVARRLVRQGLARIPPADELCDGSFLIRRRAGMGDVLCLSPLIKELERRGAECRVVCSPRHASLWQGVAELAVGRGNGYQSVNLDGWLERHPGRKERCAARCYADWWNLTLRTVRPVIALRPDEEERGEILAEQLRHGSKGLVAVFTEAGWSTRIYPHMREVAMRLAQRGYAVVGFGTEGVDGDTQLPERLPIRDLAALLKGCDLVLTGDTGPLHLAAAVRTSSVAVFGCTSAAGSIGSGYDALAIEPTELECWPCWQASCSRTRCLESVDPGDVYHAALGRLEKRPRQTEDEE